MTKEKPRRRQSLPEVRDWSMAPKTLKLSINLIPVPLHRRNLRIALKDRWRPFADAIKHQRGRRCEICGALPATALECHAHEEWSYDDHAHPCVAKLERIAIICAKCHSVEHFMQTCSRRAEGELSASDFEDIENHFFEVNGISRAELGWYLDYHFQRAREIMEHRSMWPWIIDLGDFSKMLSPHEIKSIQPDGAFFGG